MKWAGRHSFLFAATVLAVLCLSAYGTADHDVLRVPISPYPPWRIIDDDGRITGIDVEVMQELCRRMGLKLEMEQAPFARCLLLLEHGDMDMGASLQKRPERELYLQYLTPPYILGSDKVFYVLRGSGVQIRSYSDLQGLRVGVTPGTKYFPRFDNDKTLNKVAAKDYGHLITMLEGHRIDAFVYSASVGDYLVMINDCSHKIVHSPYRFTKALHGYLAISRHSPLASRLEEFNRHLQQMIDEGVVEHIMARYLSAE